MNVAKGAAGLAFATPSYAVAPNADFDTPTLTNPHGLTVTYSSDDEDIALVDENTGDIVIGSKVGTATITASTAGNDDYNAGSASYTITVSNAAPESEEIDFSKLSLTNGTQYSDPFNGGHFTITFAGGGNDGKYYTTGTGIRTYGGGTVTVESSLDIKKVEFTWDGSYAPDDASVADVGAYTVGTHTWTGSAKKIELTRPTGSGHWRLQKVKVYYK